MRRGHAPYLGFLTACICTYIGALFAANVGVHHIASPPRTLGTNCSMAQCFIIRIYVTWMLHLPKEHDRQALMPEHSTGGSVPFSLQPCTNTGCAFRLLQHAHADSTKVSRSHENARQACIMAAPMSIKTMPSMALVLESVTRANSSIGHG